MILQATDGNHRIIIRGTQSTNGTVTGNSDNMDFYEYGGYNFYTGVNTSTQTRTLALSLASDGDAIFSGNVKGATFNSLENTAGTTGFESSRDYLIAGTGNRGCLLYTSPSPRDS